MGWSIGYDSNWKRDIGYGVPALCDHPKCNEKIDRGLSYVCGGGPYGESNVEYGPDGCGLFFCNRHLMFGRSENAPQLCPACMRYDKPYKPKPDLDEWTRFKMTDPSWAEWRKEQKQERMR